MKARVAEMEQEADKLRQMQAAAESGGDTGTDAMATDEDKAAADGRSVFVGNVSLFLSFLFLAHWVYRWTMRLLRRKFRVTSKLAGQLIE
jgi:hypothetical protein